MASRICWNSARGTITSAMADDLGADLDQPVALRGRRRMLDRLGQRQAAEKGAEVVGQSVQLQPHRVDGDASGHQHDQLDCREGGSIASDISGQQRYLGDRGMGPDKEIRRYAGAAAAAGAIALENLADQKQGLSRECRRLDLRNDSTASTSSRRRNPTENSA